MSLKKKLMLYNLVLASFLVISGTIGYVGSKNAAQKYEHVVQINMRINDSIDVMDTAKNRILFNLYRLAHASFSFEERDGIVKATKDRLAGYKAAEQLYLSIPQGETTDAELYKAVATSWKVIEAHAEKFFEHTALKNEEGLKAMQTSMKENLEKDRLTYDEAIKKLTDFHRSEADKWVKAAQDTSQYANSLGILSLVAALFAFIASGLLIGQTMSRQISKLSDRLNESSTGVFQESIRVSSASTELAAAMTEQASAIQQTVSAVDEIAAMVSKTADNSMQSQNESSRMNEVAMKGKESLNEVVNSIGDISDGNTQILVQIEQGNAQLEKIVALINQIGEKTKVINDIVFQTKLLSFNASVEAARAGEHGKGFAVVAEEVGNLAQMSGNAAKEISEMLEASTNEVKKIVVESKSAIGALMEKTRGKFEDSKTVAGNCSLIFDQIISQMEAVNRNVNDIATASREQTTGIREINRVMNSLSEATQQNSLTTGDTANSALELKRQAEDVKITVGELMTLVTGQLNEHSVVRPLMKAIKPGVMARVEKSKIETKVEKTEKPERKIFELKKDAQKPAERAVAKDPETQKPLPLKGEVSLVSKTKPIASSAMIAPKKGNLLSLVGAKKEKKNEKNKPVEKPEEQPTTTARVVGGEFDSFPSSDDDRFEKV